MNYKAIIIITITLSIIACGDKDQGSDSKISSSEIQHLQIIQDNGNVPPGENRYTEYNYDLIDLSPDALQAINEISITNENLYCSNDGVTYEVNITDSYGEIFTYVSNNRDCGRDNENAFISTEDIENLILLAE